MSQLLRIGELAAKAGVSNRTVDFYTTLGLLEPAARTEAGYRLYDPSSVDLIATVRRLETHGVALEEIANALRSATRGNLDATLVQLEIDLAALREAAHDGGPHIQGLLSLVSARVHHLITAVVDIVDSSPLI